MNAIQRLDQDIINKIAAGEVVDRPANVVKELVENAIDAGSNAISIKLKAGGTEFISVTDNGLGISEADLALSIERHATSKVKTIDDLFSVATLGFRGEALSSISSVSDFTIRSKRQGATKGSMLQSIGDDASTLTSWQGGDGTHVVVENLFSQIPARLKFLKSPASEYAACLEWIHAYAFAHPEISWTLTHNDKMTLDAPQICSSAKECFADKDLFQKRVQQVYGIKDELLWVRHEGDYCQFSGMFSPPGVDRHSSKSQHVFLNGRLIKDKVIRSAINRGYHSHMLKGRYPVCFLMLEIDPTLVDVNVHPHKTEIRLQYGSKINQEIATQIKALIRDVGWAQPEVSPDPRQGASHHTPTSVSQSHNNAPAYRPSYSFPTSSVGSKPFPAVAESTHASAPETMSFNHQHTDAFKNTDADASVQDTRPNWAELEYIGCFSDCYLMFEQNGQLLVVDQHAFHERVLYEKLLKDPGDYIKPQTLLIPECVELSFSEIALLKESKDRFQLTGFDYEILGDTSLELRAVPVVLQKREAGELMSAMAQVLESGEQSESSQNLAHLEFSTIACHSAVRSGERLTEMELKNLLSQADGIDFFHNCPHGRRVFRWFQKSSVESWFDRH